MKNVKPYLLLVLAFGQIAFAGSPVKTLPAKKRVATAAPRAMQFFVNPDKLMACWGNMPLGIGQYSAQEVALQKQLNELEDGVITYSPQGAVPERDIDLLPITPYTWKWVTLEHHEADGSYTKATLRRPNEWFVANGITHVGASYHLQVPAAGIDGLVKVTNVSPSQLDTRLWEEHRHGDFAARPITGMFEHSRNNVVTLKWANQDGTIEVTDNHLFYSQTRNDWLPVASLQIGEQVKTRLGIATLEAKTPKPGSYTVYDLELYQDHNFLAGDAGLLVHNACDFTPGKKLPDSKLSGPPNKRGNAPIGNDGKPVELHHRGQKADSPLDEMTRTDHRGGANFKKNHSNTGGEKSNIDRTEFKKTKTEYWNKEWDSGRFKQ